jgi:hypothetical protein
MRRMGHGTDLPRCQRVPLSLFLMLPPLFWGVVAYTAPRKDPEVTTLMHELATLTLTTTDQYYIFLWIGVTVIALRPATQLVKNNPFPRWWGSTSLWITIQCWLIFRRCACWRLNRTPCPRPLRRTRRSSENRSRRASGSQHSVEPSGQGGWSAIVLIVAKQPAGQADPCQLTISAVVWRGVRYPLAGCDSSANPKDTPSSTLRSSVSSK